MVFNHSPMNIFKWKYILGKRGRGRPEKSLGKYSRGPYTGGTGGKGGPLLMKGPLGSAGIRGALNKGSSGGTIAGPKVSVSGARDCSIVLAIFCHKRKTDKRKEATILHKL